jgi:outer membrane scaffolding protein for murein synthesis (MipA/OmpV family)
MTCPERVCRLACIALAGCGGLGDVGAEPVPTPAVAAVASPAPGTAPLWEVGLFNAAASMPDYRGSDERTLYVLPLPYLIYRGELLQANRDGVRGIFYKGSRVETSLSFSGNPPVSNGNSARAGMPQLGPVLEVGPALRYYLYREGVDEKLYLQAAVRGAVSFDTHNLHPSYEGLRGGLSLVLEDFRLRPASPWRFGLAAGVDFSEARYNNYFYEVTADQVQPDRDEFHSAGGYSGFSCSAYTIWDLTPHFSWTFYTRWDNLDGAVYVESPLVRERNNFVVGTALIWTLWESETYVHAH